MYRAECWFENVNKITILDGIFYNDFKMNLCLCVLFDDFSESIVLISNLNKNNNIDMHSQIFAERV